MSEKSIAIIGAGIAGLAAGCYGRMNGYATNIFEMHTGPGGLCTSWARGTSATPFFLTAVKNFDGFPYDRPCASPR